MGRRFRANRDLTIPRVYEQVAGEQGRMVSDRVPVKRGDELTEEQLQPVYSGGLVAAGYLTELSEEPSSCPACAEHGTAAQKKKKYADAAELAAHYGEEHPALAPPSEEEL